MCTDLSGKEPHRYVNMGKVVSSGSLGGVIGSTIAQNARYVGLIPALDAIYPNFSTPTYYYYGLQVLDHFIIVH